MQKHIFIPKCAYNLEKTTYTDVKDNICFKVGQTSKQIIEIVA
jgi:hypothetical protein